jgi:hypothetical protein
MAGATKCFTRPLLTLPEPVVEQPNIFSRLNVTDGAESVSFAVRCGIILLT